MFNKYLLTTVSRTSTYVISKLHRNSMRKILSLFFFTFEKTKAERLLVICQWLQSN